MGILPFTPAVEGNMNRVVTHLISVLVFLSPAVLLAQEPLMENMTMLSHLPLEEMGGINSSGNDIWGWTDEQTKKEYVIFGRTNGTSFIDVSNPQQPVYLGDLPSRTGSSTWRDMKVFADHAFIVSDGNGPHGLQVFDLTQLRDVTDPRLFQPTAVDDTFRNAHNIAINEETGFAYIVGADVASGGLHILDINDPLMPIYAGEYADDGYTHDAQIVTYAGEDSRYSEREIAFNSNTDTLTIVDVTDKSAPTMLSRVPYPESVYTHQGWLSDDQNYFFVNDELDEFYLGLPSTRTHVFDVSQLDNAEYVGFYEHEELSIDHNLYVVEDKIYAANYTAGLRVVQVNDAGELDMEEVAFFDPNPELMGVGGGGLWSVYPFFESGNIVVSDINLGLYVIRMDGVGEGGDFNADGIYDCLDIDALVAAIAAGADDLAFDLDGSGELDIEDVTAWLAEAGAANLPSGNSYLFGDANLDGVVDVSDFGVWNMNKFSTTGAWCLADFNADGATDVSDFNDWNTNKFRSSGDVDPDAAPVPEPAAGFLALIGLVFLLARRRI